MFWRLLQPWQRLVPRHLQFLHALSCPPLAVSHPTTSRGQGTDGWGHLHGMVASAVNHILIITVCTEQVGLFVPKLPWLSAAVSGWDALKGEHQPEQNRTWQGDSLSPASLHCARDGPNPQPLRWVSWLKSFALLWLSVGGKKICDSILLPCLSHPRAHGSSSATKPSFCSAHVNLDSAPLSRDDGN